MDALLFPGRLRPGKRSASIGRRLYNYLAPYLTTNDRHDYVENKYSSGVFGNLQKIKFKNI